MGSRKRNSADKIKEAKQKLEMLENELPSMLHESIEFQRKQH